MPDSDDQPPEPDAGPLRAGGPNASPSPSSTGAPAPSEYWKRWRTDIEYLSHSITNLYARQLVWKEYCKALDDLEISASASIWHDWIINNHADAMTMGIRRLIDRETKSNSPVSLHTLITDIAAHSEELRLEQFLAVWNPRQPFDGEMATETFTNLFPTPDSLTPAALLSEAASMRKSAESILRHADTRVAHTDRKAASALPTWAEVDCALEVVATVFRRYYLLLTCNDYRLRDPIMPFGWEAAIRQGCLASIHGPVSNSASGTDESRS